MVFPRTIEFSVLMQIRFAMACSHHLPFFAERGGGRDEEVDCIPTDYPARVRRGYTAFGHSDNIQESKSQVIIMRMRNLHLRPAKILLRFKSFSLVEVVRRENNLLGFPNTRMDAPTNYKVCL